MQEYRDNIAKCNNLAELDKIRIALLGKKGLITGEFSKLKDLDENTKTRICSKFK